MSVGAGAAGRPEALGRNRAGAGARRGRRHWHRGCSSSCISRIGETDDAAAQSAIKAASDGTVALLSYSPESLDKDFATAKSKLTGSFLSYYTQFTEQIVAPAAKQKSVKTKASVVRAAVSEIHPDTAVVLVFINQTTESADRPDASFINSAVRVTMQKVDGGWLISSFDPV